ncbi:MAG: sigma-70 family RNA polymerase sigma factor [Clostridia bacterium]|nr:sigma-70 family RNA polymerase sigma factor [Clostridia bacterium]
MVRINLKKYYPDYYTEDTYVEVEEKVAEFMEKEQPKPASAKRKEQRYKVLYSLDAGDGIEEETLIRMFFEAEQNERIRDILEEAMSASLTPTQERRIRMRYFDDMPYKLIAAAENVSIGTIESTIDDAKKNLRNYLCKHSMNRP